MYYFEIGFGEMRWDVGFWCVLEFGNDGFVFGWKDDGVEEIFGYEGLDWY